MKRIKLLLENTEYQKMLDTITKAEKDRIFCRHTLQHFFDTARILYIFCLEEKLDIDKELIYAIGLLHDIGRASQYTDGTEHHKASADAARYFMPLCGFSKNETERAAAAILSHRSGDNDDEIAKLLYKADKKSRLCFDCAARGECNWSREKMNLEPFI